MSKIRFVTPPYRLVTLASDINNIKEIYSDDELNRLLETVNQNCPTRIILRTVGKSVENMKDSLEDKNNDDKI
ncbi:MULTISPECIES: hypothetical protein [Escherichia]|uniref:hypothetical protein n=1 Tax=Escherichia TaxID=561 RepID=UPI00031D63B0|nr:hypothetical protein [Escherichia coli]MBN6378037.1 hypothetical protein [Escherichia coli]HAH3341820.1 hypothetical protein [Escherichia coli]HAV8843977.1 hypothetical protein [Escherichia coli]HBA4300035.1 hypothetical protein [Escherichia coli]